MKFKKLLAGLLAGAMVLGCVPQSAWGANLGQVQAEDTETTEVVVPYADETTEEANYDNSLNYGKTVANLTDHEGRKCTFIARHGNGTTNISGNGQTLFDYVYSGNTYLYTHGGEGNVVKYGDYVGLVYEEPIQMQAIRFTFAPTGDSSTDHYYASKFQYLKQGESEWKDVEGATFENVTTCRAVLPESLQSENIVGIRLVNTGEEHGAWIRVHEIEVNPPLNVYRAGFTDESFNKAVLEVLHQGQGHQNGTETYLDGNLSNCTDNDTSTGVTFKGASNHYNNDQVANGDYIAVLYKEVLPINRINFVFTSSEDRMKQAKLQYTLDGVTWTDIPDIGNVGKQETVDITSEQLPSNFEAKGIRMLNTETVRQWLALKEVNIECSYVSTEKIASVTTGSSCGGTTGTDRGAEGANDKDLGTVWHSNYDKGSDSKEKFWYDVKFTESTLVDGIRALPRKSGQNGVITKYEVWVSNVDEPRDLSDYSNISNTEDGQRYTEAWQSEYTKVCEGTWANDGDGSTIWKTASFEPVEARHVRIYATETQGTNASQKNYFASMVEFMVEGATAKTSFFKGGSLRMDNKDDVHSNMRYQYEFPTTLKEMSLQDNEWSWNYYTVNSEGAMKKGSTKVTSGQRRIQDGTCYSNLVFKDIATENYDKAIYAQLVIPYTNTSGEELKVYTSVENRTVAGVAEKVAQYGSTAEQRAYATALLEAISTGN